MGGNGRAGWDVVAQRQCQQGHEGSDCPGAAQHWAWLVRRVTKSDDVGARGMRKALTADAPGCKMIVASSERALTKHRREKPLRAAAMAAERGDDPPQVGG